MEPSERQRLMDEGRSAFDRGEFFEAHESWESVWDVIDPPERTWVQGLIQIATGLHQLERGREDVCTLLLRKALAKLEGAPDTLDGIDVAAARRGAERIVDEIARGERAEARSVLLDRARAARE